MPLYGHELSPHINPLEARLGWTVSWNKNFIGRDALLKVKLEKPGRVLVGLEMVDKAVPREHYAIAVNGLRGTESNPRIDGTQVPVFHLQNLTPADPPHDQ